MTTTLILPGLNSSGPAHWQSWFEEQLPGALRVNQADWNNPDLAAWAQRVRRDIARISGQVLLVAHSFGSLAAAQAANDYSEKVAGALLVAPADPDKFGVADVLPHRALAFPTMVVASRNDPWMSLERAAHWANIWGAEFIDLGAAGHINTEAGFGPWPQGLSLFERLSVLAGSHAQPLQIYGQNHRQRRRSPARRGSVMPIPGSKLDIKRAAALLTNAGWKVQPPYSVIG